MNSMVRLLLKSADNGGRCSQTMTSVWTHSCLATLTCTTTLQLAPVMTVSNWHQSTSQPVVHQTVTCVWTANKQSFNRKTDEMKQTVNQ